MVAVGGDGTINTVAQMCWAAGLPVGAVACAIFNYFARQHGLSIDPHQALRAIVRCADEGQWTPVQVGRVNGQVFLVNASLGLYPRLLAEREVATGRFGRHRAVALAAGLRTLLWPAPAARYHLAWLDGEDKTPQVERVEASTLFIGNNALQLASVGLPDTDAVGSGALKAVMLSAAASRWTIARQLWRAAMSSLADEPSISSHSFTRLVLDRHERNPSAPVRVAYDGERNWMRLPLRFEVDQLPLCLLGCPSPAPREEAQASDAQRPDTTVQGATVAGRQASATSTRSTWAAAPAER